MYEKEIETPVGKHKVLIKTMLTGAEREQVNDAHLAYLDSKDGTTLDVKDMKKVQSAKKHELLRVSVKSIDGDETNCFERLQKMFEPDYNFVYEQIKSTQEDQKKAFEPTTELTSGQ